MELRQEKKNNTLKYILLCVFAGLILAVAAAIRTVYGADIFVAYEHEKLYNEFKESYALEGTVPQETSDYGGITLVENENFAVKYVYEYELFTLSFENKNTGKKYNNRAEIYGVNSAGEIVTTYTAVGGERYYDPYTKELEHTVRFIEVDEEKVVIEVLLLQSFFVNKNYFPYAQFMTVEDFETYVSTLSEDSQRNFNHIYMLTTFDEISPLLRELFFEDDGEEIPGIDYDKFSEQFYFGKPMGVDVSNLMEEAGYTIEEKRMQESKFIKKGYEAPMALARFTVDISGEELTYDAELVKVISPKKSDVVDISVPEDSRIAYNNWKIVDDDEDRKNQVTANIESVVGNVDTNYSEYPVDFELELNKSKVDASFLLNDSYGFGTMNIRIFDNGSYETLYSGTINEGEPLNVELLEAKYSGNTYKILMYNESFIYGWQLAVKLSGGDDLSVSKKNLLFNEMESVSFDVYGKFTDEQLTDYSQVNDFDWDKYGDLYYHESLDVEKYYNLYEGENAWFLSYFRSDDPDARYLIRVTRRAGEWFNADDPCVLEVEVCGDMILEPFFMEYGVGYDLTITRLDDGTPSPYAMYEYLLR